MTLASRNEKVRIPEIEWGSMEPQFGAEQVASLREEFEQHSACPREEDILEIWEPFSEHLDLKETWKGYHDFRQRARMVIPVAELKVPDSVQMCLRFIDLEKEIWYIYQGIVAGKLRKAYTLLNNGSAVFLMGSAWKPEVNISRSRISELPFYAILAISGILNKHQMGKERISREIIGWKSRSLKEWLEIKEPQLDRWLQKNLKDLFTETKRMLQKKFEINENYEEGQVLSFYEKEDGKMEEAYDLFPPMMFCMAASDGSRQFICSVAPYRRRCITADHPFILWLLDHAAQLKQYYQRQFHQIASCLCDDSAEEIIRVCNKICEQLLALPNRHGIDVSSFPQLSKDDFWTSY